jgi:hypothetical protein
LAASIVADAGSASSASSRARVVSSETSAVPADEVTETLPPAAEPTVRIGLRRGGPGRARRAPPTV